MTKYHVEFDFESSCNHIEDATEIRIYNPNPYEIINLPGKGKITKIIEPLKDGYYLMKRNSSLYRKNKETWQYKGSANYWKNSMSFTNDERVREEGYIYLGPIVKEECIHD